LFVEILTPHLERQKILVVTATDKFELSVFLCLLSENEELLMFMNSLATV